MNQGRPIRRASLGLSFHVDAHAMLLLFQIIVVHLIASKCAIYMCIWLAWLRLW